MSDLSRIMDSHKIVLVPGVPDYYKIRLMETEIHGAPVTEYPGEWDDLTKDDHYKSSHFRYGLTGHERCMWCEDARRKSKITQAEVRADMDAAVRRTREADRPRRMPRMTPLGVLIIGWIIGMSLVAVGVIWG